MSEEDITWADSANTSVERVQDGVRDAISRLNSDATTAIGHIREAQTQYDSFDEMYNDAVGRFISGVESAQAKEREFRENVKFVATTTFAVVAPTASAMYSAMDGALTKVQRVSSIVSSATARRTPADTSGGTSPGAAARREDRVDWSNLLSTTLTAFEDTVQNNTDLSNIANSCVDIVRFLDSVQERRYTGDNPQSAPLGQQANRMVDNLSDILSNLNGITAGVISGPTETLKNQIVERLGSVTPRQLEQDIAIRWMGGLGRNELDQIDLADAYLARIGVFDRGDNRLDYDTGTITTDIDERILHWRASWESSAMSLVGSTVLWLGNPFAPRELIDDGERCVIPRTYSGQIRDDHNGEWNVNIPGGAPPEGGGQLLLTGYTVDHMDSSGWEWSYPGDLRQRLRWEIRFTAQAVGQLGGGAPAAGPVINPL
ncbi:MAG: hypothetical protein Q9P01_19305 [Anaerolineae bacterium]|nr:hypothetical protein [Anaerolineae bacterium]